MRRGFGVDSEVPAPTIGVLARSAESSGYRTFWTNDSPDGDGLEALRAAADATDGIGLGVGLLPLDRWPAAAIVARVRELRLPVGRLAIGLGAGAAPQGLARVRAAVPVVASTGAGVVVGALGPRMCALAGEIADGVLLDWPTPASVAVARDHIAVGARSAARGIPRVAGYVFTALGASGAQRLRADAAHYASVPAYAAHFARAGADPLDAAACAEEPSGVREQLARYDVVLDEVVVRAVAADRDAASYRRVLDAAAPLNRPATG